MVKRILLALVVALIALCVLGPSTTGSDDFIPPDLSQASMMACGIGRNADGSVDSILGVSYVHEVKSQWRVLMARHDGDAALEQAADACIQWWKDMKVALRKVGKNGK